MKTLIVARVALAPLASSDSVALSIGGSIRASQLGVARTALLSYKIKLLYIINTHTHTHTYGVNMKCVSHVTTCGIFTYTRKNK